MVFFVTGILLDLSVAIKQVTVSVAIIQLEVFGAHMQVTVPAAKIGLKFKLQLCRWYYLQCIMHMTVSIVIMQASLL